MVAIQWWSSGVDSVSVTNCGHKQLNTGLCSGRCSQFVCFVLSSRLHLYIDFVCCHEVQCSAVPVNKAKKKILKCFYHHLNCSLGNYFDISGTTMTDKLSVLPFSKAISTMQSANDDEDERPDFWWPIKSQMSSGVKLSNIPSDATTR